MRKRKDMKRYCVYEETKEGIIMYATGMRLKDAQIMTRAYNELGKDEVKMSAEIGWLRRIFR